MSSVKLKTMTIAFILDTNKIINITAQEETYFQRETNMKANLKTVYFMARDSTLMERLGSLSEDFSKMA
jgi:hypothetical protein